MPVNKNASFRWRVLDRCLRDRNKNWTKEMLMDEVSNQLSENGFAESIGDRTFRYDISFMKSEYPRGYNAPIVCEKIGRDKWIYYYSDPNFTINDSKLNETDIANLEEAANVLKQFKDLPFYNEIQGTITKIESERVIDDSPGEKYILLDNNKNFKGSEYLNSLYQSIKEREVLKVTYKPFTEEEPRIFTKHPFFLKEYNNRWYLVGWNEELQLISHFGIERILDVEKIKNHKFASRHRKEALNLYDNIVGVTYPDNSNLEEIHLWLHPGTAPYILTKPIHQSQEVIKSNKKETIISLNLIVNFEFRKFILAQGGRIKVLKPKSLKDEVIKEIELSLKNYK